MVMENLFRHYGTDDPDEIYRAVVNEDHFISGPFINSQDTADVLHFFVEEGYDFITLMRANWTSLDAFSHLTFEFSEEFKLAYDPEMGRYKSADEIILDEDREWWDALPDQLKIYRGCDKFRTDGLSWTVDRKVAEGFADGHRGVQATDPVIASAKIQKSDVWFATNERQEQEIVWNPEDKEIQITPFIMS